MCALLLSPFTSSAVQPVQETDLAADEDHLAQRYRTREERREAGGTYELGGGFSLAGLAELSRESIRYSAVDAASSRDTPREELSLEIVLEYAPENSVISAEAVWEYDSISEKVLMDEAILALNFKSLEVEMGRYYVPFGEYFSSFVTGPLIEFAETRGKVLQLNYAPLENFELSPFVYQGRSLRMRDREQVLSWGAAFEWEVNEALTLGASYLSNLADSDEELLADEDNEWSRRVPALSTYVLMGAGAFEFSTEMVSATSSFPELEQNANRPFAWNSELGVSLSDYLSVSLRYETSKEIEDAPERRYGIAASLILPKTFVTIEYLLADYASGFVEDEQDNELKASASIAAQISFTF
ncbi:MAG: LbtU family siderophore porin [Oceanococcus sp.]